MARFYKFVIHLEDNVENLTLEELQKDYNEAVELEDYKLAGQIKKDIDKRINNNEPVTVVELQDYCYLDLDEVATFYKSEWLDGEKFTKVILKGGFELPLAISFEEFTILFFKV